MISYKSLTGSEVLYWHGTLYFWVPDGVYSLRGASIRRHGSFSGPREIIATLVDTTNNFTKDIQITYDDAFDDYEIINRWITGTASCDCVRGRMLYDDGLNYPCNTGPTKLLPNRFILRRLAITANAIKGDRINCIMTYKGFA